MFKYVFSFLAGSLLSLGFDRNIWWFSVIALTALLWILDRNCRATRIWILFIFSTSFFAQHYTWMQVIGPDAWLLVTALGVIPWLFLGLIDYKKNSLASLAYISFALVATELVRSHFPFGGFPWGLVAYSQVDGPLVVFSRLGSSALVSFLTMFLAGLLLQLLSGRYLNSIVFICLVFIFASVIRPVMATGHLALVAIQGNVPRIGLELTAQRRAVLDNHLSVTAEFLNSTDKDLYPKLVIWPESSTDIDPVRNREVAAEITALVESSNVPILVGATTFGTNPDGPRNTGILWEQSGPSEFYVKNNLVPFGEYIPFRNLLTDYIDRIRLVPNDFVPGNELGIFKVNNVRFGDVICFEISFGNYVRQVVNSEIDFLTVQTNNATYGLTKQPEQQFTITRFRAIEHQRSVIVASTSGISGAINQNGMILAKTEQFVPAVVEVQLPLSTSQSFSDKFPGWMSILSAFIVGLHSLRTALRSQQRERIS